MFSLHELGISFQDMHKENAFGFVDADNVKFGFEQCLRRAGFDDEELDLFDLERIFWPFFLKRYFIYSAVEAGMPPPAWIANLRAKNGYLFRETLLKKVNGKRKQEGVDVRLAVEAMQFAFRRKMSHALIFSGDGDLLPLVDALVDEGVITAVISFGNPEKSQVSARLRDKADGYLYINQNMLAECLTNEHSKHVSGDLTHINDYEVLENLTEKEGRPRFILRHKSTGKHALCEQLRGNDHFRYIGFRSLNGAKAWFKLRNECN